jgi:hypothetical protein
MTSKIWHKMIPINLFPKEFPNDALNIIFLNVPGIERLTVLPLVCKDWHAFINLHYKKLIDLDAISKATFNKIGYQGCDDIYDPFIKQYKKLKFYKLYGDKSSFITEDTTAKSFNGQSTVNYFLTHGSSHLFFILNQKKRSFNFEKNHYLPKTKNLRLGYILALTSKTITIEEKDNPLPPRIAYREVYVKSLMPCCSEKRKLYGWKKDWHGDVFCQLRAVGKYVEYFYNFMVESIVEYNKSLFIDTSIEDLESYTTLYCSRLGRVTKMENVKKFNFVIERIHLNSKQLRTLSWESQEIDFSDGLDSAILADVLSKTTHYLTHKLGLDILDGL